MIVGGGPSGLGPYTPQMAFATGTKAFPAYSPTSTPILDVLRPAPRAREGSLTTGEYFFLGSLVIGIFVFMPRVREALGSFSSASLALAIVVIAMPAAALGGALLVHEIGHFAAGWAAGFRPNRMSSDSSSALQALHACESACLDGLLIEPPKTRSLRRGLAVLFFGGPCASFLSAAGAELYLYRVQTGSMVQLWVHLFAALNVLVSMASLLPDTKRGGKFSDGARLIMLGKNDARAARWFAILEMQLAFHSGVHPRDWDPDVVARATMINDGSRDAVTANWLAYLWASERQDITSATKYLEDALTAPSACSRLLRRKLFLEAAFFQAWFRDNPEKARSWAAFIPDKKLASFELQRLNIALLWAEGKLFDAFEKWPAYFESLRQTPESPARVLAEKSALEWKHQMESRMLTRAWRALSILQEVELAGSPALPAATGADVSSW